jgi:hypothetical protein
MTVRPMGASDVKGRRPRRTETAPPPSTAPVLAHAAIRSRVPFPMTSLVSSTDVIRQAVLDSGVDSASNPNEYQKQKNDVSGEHRVAGAYG